MQKLIPVTIRDIDKLLTFLPTFEQLGGDFEPHWDLGDSENQSWDLPDPEYPREVENIFDVLSKPCWSDFNYRPEKAQKMIEDDGLIEIASLPQIKTMLTYCARGERFCMGHWGLMIRSGKVLKLLKRLKTLRDSKDLKGAVKKR